jgi:hypothetical protein
MAIDPIAYASTPAPSEFDFTALTRLGEQLKAQQNSKLLASLQERYGASDPTARAAPTPGGVVPSAVAAPSAGGTDQYGRAISSIESGGRYDLLGPVTKTGDRAYGKYQVMGANVPEWTRAALGRPMTPQEYLADKDAQEAVFKHRFGSYVQKYGPGGAARAWFAGEGGMKNPNARDQLGTSVAEYERRFNSGLGSD